MIGIYKHKLAWLAILILFLSVLGFSQMKAKKSSSGTKMISGMGCVGPGVEERCILLTDAKTHVLYNLYFNGKRPLFGSTIQFTGKKHTGPITCMQGQPVDVTKWTKIDNSCPPR